MTATDVVRVPLHELNDEYVGLRLLICGEHNGKPMAVCGGVSDLARLAPGSIDVWLGGVRVRVGPSAVVVAAAPPEA